ncbi:MAG: hypothetical protein A4E35_01803 [Methanoregula sp. PtaU1.Bin051]|nr:MAG: hypothetical protein A4E35_01803 [Methanoregula sp. PtaU1.Bin051]
MAEIPSENSYLIEIRLTRTKWRIKRTTETIVRLFSIENYAEKHPHVTLFGPFSLKDDVPVEKLLNAIEIAAAPFSSVPFLIDGYDMNQGLNGAVIAYRIVPDDSLISLSGAISSSVRPLAQAVNVWDMDPDRKWYHVTIANRLDRREGSIFFQWLKGQEAVSVQKKGAVSHITDKIQLPLNHPTGHDGEKCPHPPLLDDDGIRISVIHGDQILSEYDLIRHCWVSTNESDSGSEWRRSLKQFRIHNGIELTARQNGVKNDIYVISDLHLSHANIIKYCSRPFPHDSIEEMDDVLIRNWNYTVHDGDLIYHLGDLCYGPHAKSLSDYARRLNGSITLIHGNHDTGMESSCQVKSLVWQGIPFTLVHDPDSAQAEAGDWIVHGHHHNNNLMEYPFINFEKQRINVSAEIVKYRPVSLTAISQIIRDHRMKPDIKRLLLR